MKKVKPFLYSLLTFLSVFIGSATIGTVNNTIAHADTTVPTHTPMRN